MSDDHQLSQTRPRLADGAPVSRFCFGAMQFGSGADRTAAHAMYDACRAAGINSFDTAHVYTDGLSETWLGELIRSEREKVYIASKVSSNGPADRDTICAQMDESRRRLDLDCLDAVYLHRWDAETPLEETFETLAELRVGGAFRDLGVSNYAAWQVMKAVGVAKQFGLRITLLQPMFSLVKRQAEVELLPMARDQGIAVAPYSPLGGGLLTGKYGAGESGRLTHDRRYSVRYGQPWMYETASALSRLADEVGTPAATLAVAWVARNPEVTAPIISARSPAQLEPSLAAINFVMDDTLYRRVSALSPTPPPATDRLEEA